MKPLLSIIVVSYNIERELPRTLYSMSPRYQHGMDALDYEVIVVDNGSERTPTPGDFTSGPLDVGDLDIKVIEATRRSPSPVGALNEALNVACGQYIGVFIDGARMLSPGLLRRATEALDANDRAIVATRGRYLGPMFQRLSMDEGYDREAEDTLLAQTRWQEDGYRLFDISVFDESSGPTWWDSLSESNGLFMSRQLWAELNGFDHRFEAPGGGLVNLDLWVRANALEDVSIVALLGEATFHQFHGGVATNGQMDVIDAFFDEYEEMRGIEFRPPDRPISSWGSFVVAPARNEMMLSARRGAHRTPIADRVEQHSSALPSPVRRGLVRGATLVDETMHHGVSSQVRRRVHRQSDAELVRNSRFFDRDWYVQTYPDVLGSRHDPALHYVKFGYSQRRIPGPLFDADWYLDRYYDVDDAGLNPLVHYLRFGKAEGRRIRILDGAEDGEIETLAEVLSSTGVFDERWYAERYPEVARSEIVPLVHCARFGLIRGNHPGPDFIFLTGIDHVRNGASDDRQAWIEVFRDRDTDGSIASAAAEGARQRREDRQLVAESDLFDESWYTTTYTQAARSSFVPLDHYLLVGYHHRLAPGPRFDPAAYLFANPDVSELGVDPLLHYLRCGRFEGRGGVDITSSSPSRS